VTSMCSDRHCWVAGALDKALAQVLTTAVPSLVPCTDAHALFSLAQVLLDLSAFGQAVLVMERVTLLRPTSGAAEHQLGLVLGKSGLTELALRAYHRALVKDPSLAISHNNLGVLLSKLGKYDVAAQHYRKALDIAPDYQDAIANLAAVHRARRSFRDLVLLHLNASLYCQARASKHTTLVVAGYHSSGDGLGSHSSHVVPLLRRLLPSAVESFDTTAPPATQPSLDSKRVLVVVEPYRLQLPRGLHLVCVCVGVCVCVCVCVHV